MCSVCCNSDPRNEGREGDPCINPHCARDRGGVLKRAIELHDLPDEEIARRAKTIRPVVKFGEKLHYIKPVDLHTVAYTWDPKKAEKATGLKPLKEITTLHRWSYYGFFKPSIAEVLSQIPEDLVDRVVAFQIIECPETAEDLNKNYFELISGFHVATTLLYERDTHA